MSAFADAVHRLIEDELRCPRCHAANRPGAHLIEPDWPRGLATCNVCSHTGPIRTFEPEALFR